MKLKTLLMLAMVLFVTNAYSQQLEQIPDDNLRAFLKSKFPECFEGALLNVSCSTVQELTELDVSGLGISDLSGLQHFQKLMTLACSNNNILSLEGVLPSSVVWLYCNDNKLSSLPALPPNLQTLDCGGNLLTSLPVFPETIDWVGCVGNKISIISDLPENLGTLYADSNMLTSVPKLPGKLRGLSIAGNNVKSLPELPGTLIALQVGNNQIASLPALPASIRDLDVSSNNLTSLPDLPSGLWEFNCSNNRISCLPYLPQKLIHLNFKNNPITCIPNMPRRLTLFEGTTTVMCNAQNTRLNNCDFYVPVRGNVYIDYNGNHTKDAEDTDMPSTLLSTNNINDLKTLTDYAGNYSLYLSPGQYEYNPVVSDTLFTIYPKGQLITVANDASSSLNYDYALTPVGEVRDLTVKITPLATMRPGFWAYYVITCTNSGNRPVSQANMQFQYPSQLFYTGSDLTFSSHHDTTITWDIPLLNPGQSKNIKVLFTISSGTALGTMLTSKAVLTPFNARDISKNSDVIKQIVTGSYDPNDKIVFPSGNITPEQVANNIDLEYIIRFQNTGTDTAFTVIVTDTLSPLLNHASLVMVSAGHKYFYQQTGNIVSWVFENINLPDSTTNEQESHGYIRFKINPLPGLQAGDLIKNTANIYFDFNEPVITDTAKTPIMIVTGLSAAGNIPEPGLNLFPNPCNAHFNLSFESPENTGNAYVVIRNYMNQEIDRKVFNAVMGHNTIEYDVQDIAPGMYYIEVSLGKKAYGQKLLKW